MIWPIVDLLSSSLTCVILISWRQCDKFSDTGQHGGGTFNDVTHRRRYVTSACVGVYFRRAKHHPTSTWPESRRQRYRDVYLHGDWQPDARHLLPASWRPAHRCSQSSRSVLGNVGPARSCATYQPSQCATWRRSHRVCCWERPRRPGHCIGHLASLRRGTWSVVLSTTSNSNIIGRTWRIYLHVGNANTTRH